MANEILLKFGTQLVFADFSGDFSGGTAKTSLEQAGATQVQLDTTSLANGAGRESAKVDLGATRARRYSVMASIEFGATPTPSDVVELYWAPSPDAVAANGNIMGIDGIDAAAPSGIGTLAELVAASQFIGDFICTDDATPAVQTAWVASFAPPERYGILIVKNEAGSAFHSDAAETHFVFDPIVDEVQ